MAFVFKPHSMRNHTVNREGRRVYTVRYTATTNLPGVEGPVACRLAYDTQFPVGIGFTYYGDSDLQATRTRDFTVTPLRQASTGTAEKWYIDATFDTGDATNCGTESFENEPWTHPWSRSKQNIRVMKPVEVDKDGEALQNTAGDPFNPPFELEYIESQLVLSGNMQTLNVNSWAAYEDNGGAVNNATIGSFAARTLRVVELSWNEAWYGTCTPYFQVRAVFAFNGETHDMKIEHWGREAFDEAGGNKQPILGRVTRQPLDANGVMVPDAPLPREPHKESKRVLPELAYPPPGIPAGLFTF
jgi:hypothetical protein